MQSQPATASELKDAMRRQREKSMAARLAIALYDCCVYLQHSIVYILFNNLLLLCNMVILSFNQYDGLTADKLQKLSKPSSFFRVAAPRLPSSVLAPFHSLFLRQSAV